MAYTIEPITSHILKLVFIGDVNDEEADRLVADFDQYLVQAKTEKPIHILADASRSGKVSSKTRRLFADQAKNPLVGNTAIIGVNRALKVLAIFIAKASGRGSFHFFDTEVEALAWLKQDLVNE